MKGPDGQGRCDVHNFISDVCIGGMFPQTLTASLESCRMFAVFWLSPGIF